MVSVANDPHYSGTSGMGVVTTRQVTGVARGGPLLSRRRVSCAGVGMQGVKSPLILL